MPTKDLPKKVDDRSLQNTQLDVPKATLLCGGPAIGTYVGAQLGGPQGAAVGAVVGTFASTVALGGCKEFEVQIDRSGQVKVRYETRDLF